MEHNKKAEEEWSNLLPKLQLLSLTEDSSPVGNTSNTGLHHYPSDSNSDVSSFLGQKGAGNGITASASTVAATNATNDLNVYTSFGRPQHNSSPPPAPSSLPPPPPPLPPAAPPTNEYEDVYDETS
jgi:hypothetical protein